MKRIALIVLLTFGGCASADQTDARDDAKCRGYGAEPGSSAYVECRVALNHEREANLRAVMARSHASSEATPSNASAVGRSRVGDDDNRPGSRAASGTTCFAKGEQASGMNKICFYDCLGSPVAVTVSSYSTCAVTIKR